MISRWTAVMNSKLYGPRAQVTHISGEAQWRRGCPAASTAIQSGWASLDVVVGGVRVGPREHDHAELAAALDQLAERVAVAQPAAAVVERDLGGIVGDAAAGAEAGARRCGCGGSSRARTPGRTGPGRPRPASAAPSASGGRPSSGRRRAGAACPGAASPTATTAPATPLALRNDRREMSSCMPGRLHATRGG